jgi:hypothetical protein
MNIYYLTVQIQGITGIISSFSPPPPVFCVKWMKLVETVKYITSTAQTDKVQHLVKKQADECK